MGFHDHPALGEDWLPLAPVLIAKVLKINDAPNGRLHGYKLSRCRPPRGR